MVPDLTLEVIYLNQTTDFKMEFDICGCCNVRFLSHITHNRQAFLSDLSKGVVRSRVIVAVGSFNPLDRDYIPKIIAKATGYVQKQVDKERLGICTAGVISLPEGSIPLISKDGLLGGCVMENNDQAIIMLTSDREVRHELIEDLVCPYLKLIVGKKKEETSFLKECENNSFVKSDKAGAADNKTGVNKSGVVSLQKEREQSSAVLLKEEQAENIDLNDILSSEEKEPFVVLDQPENHIVSGYTHKDFIYEEDEKNANKKQIIKAIISVILVLLVLLAAYFGYELVFQPVQYSSVTENTLELYGQPWEELPSNMLYKFGKLYKTNKDVVGWLSIPGTAVNLPVVSSAGRADNYYKTHLFEGSVSNFGTPFTNSKIKEDTYNRNIVVFGKAEGNNFAFSDIKGFLNVEKYRSAPVLSFDTVYLEHRWKIFSVYSTDKKQFKNQVKTSFFNDSEFLDYANSLVEKSQIKTNIDILPDDEILTLVAEDSNENVVLVARRVRDGEAPLVDIETIIQNPEKEASSGEASNPLTEISSSVPSKNTTSFSKEDLKAEKNVADNGTSRPEQQSISSATVIKPTENTVQNTPPKPEAETSSDDTSSASSSEDVLPALPVITVKNNLDEMNPVTGPANEIVAQILEGEMGSYYHIEALKAQAVATYSWLLCNGVTEGSVPEAPMKKAGERAVQAANAVAGVVALYEGNVAQTFYHAISAGSTANSSVIMSNQLPYLESVDSSVDKNVEGYRTIRTYKASDIAEGVKESLNVDLNRISNKNEWFKCTYDQNGLYVKTVSIGGNLQSGAYLRKNLFTAERVGADNTLRSGAYTITYNSDDTFTFVVKGYGHGVGMSQVGANAYAKNGWNYEEILKHYFKGITFGMYVEEQK